MSTAGSVTLWISKLKAGNRAAAQALWERYVRRLVGLAGKQLAGTQRRAANEEDVVQNAFASFFCGLEQGRFPQLRDRENLWSLLAVITARKAIDLVHYNNAQKRKILGESALRHLVDSSGVRAGIENVPSPEPTPEFIAQMAEECEQLVARLGDDKLRQVAQLKLDCYTDKEAAAHLGVSVRTVERKLERIRCIWKKELPDER
ncbi:MAG TPA: ECF-type sigma factor [Gemmataceae bacterium]|nr:ECF-type sigma factor [Gemmataceae bacterium]